MTETPTYRHCTPIARIAVGLLVIVLWPSAPMLTADEPAANRGPSAAPGSRVEYRAYPSSHDPSLRLYANFVRPAAPRPLLVVMHGWHGHAKGQHAQMLEWFDENQWFMIEPDMRGRADSTGRPDANGWELQDVVDAVEFAKREYSDSIAHPELVYLRGVSGGGGNTLALVGKFPDYFAAAVCEAGISDYALWFRNDTVSEFRDEMRDQGWIGGTPDTSPEAYASRGGITLVENLNTPLLIVHATGDVSVPIQQARAYVARAQDVGKREFVDYLELADAGGMRHFEPISPAQRHEREQRASQHLGQPRQSITIPNRGSFVVAGYLKTKSFEVVLDDVDQIGEVNYDLDERQFYLRSRSAKGAILRVKHDGQWEERHIAIEPSS